MGVGLEWGCPLPRTKEDRATCPCAGVRAQRESPCVGERAKLLPDVDPGSTQVLPGQGGEVRHLRASGGLSASGICVRRTVTVCPRRQWIPAWDRARDRGRTVDGTAECSETPDDGTIAVSTSSAQARTVPDLLVDLPVRAAPRCGSVHTGARRPQPVGSNTDAPGNWRVAIRRHQSGALDGGSDGTRTLGPPA